MKQARLPATQRRAKRYGLANQMAYESNERAERAATVLGMQRSNAERKRKAAMGSTTVRKAKAKSKEKGANAGTYGASRASMLFGR